MSICICDETPHHHECPQAQDTYNPDIHAATQTAAEGLRERLGCKCEMFYEILLCDIE